MKMKAIAEVSRLKIVGSVVALTQGPSDPNPESPAGFKSGTALDPDRLEALRLPRDGAHGCR
jgi:hypothetical protein